MLSRHIFQSTVAPFVRKLDQAGFIEFKLSKTLEEIIATSGKAQSDLLTAFGAREDQQSIHEYKSISEFEKNTVQVMNAFETYCG